MTAGAITFHPGVFTTALGGVQPVPGDAREYIWQLAAPAYAQAIASQVEPLMRSSKIVYWHDYGRGAAYELKTSTTLRHYTETPEQLVGVRQVLDSSGAARPHYLISAALEGYENGTSGQWQRTANVRFVLDDQAATPLLVTLPARRQGSFYELNLGGSSPLLIQYDAWHEDGHFSYWAKQFAFSAAVTSARGAGSGAQTLALARRDRPHS